MDLQPVLDFIEFCLLPYLSHKEIQLIQLKITQARPKQKDAFYLECFYYQKALNLVRRHKKNASHALQHSETSLYSALIRMDADDIFLVLTPGRYKVSEEALAIIIGKPADSLAFRRNQIIQQYQSEGLKKQLQNLMNVSIAELSKDVLLHSETHTKNAVQEKLSRISKIPVPLKFVLEMASVLVLLFFIMWLVPQIRSTYENSVQKRINEYLIDASLTDSPPPAGLAKPKAPEVQSEAPSNLTGVEEPVLPVADAPTHKQPKVSEGETWRFSFTGQGQTDLESQLAEVIENKSKQKIKPLVVPGGIQYEFFLSTTEVIPLKVEFEQITSLLQRKAASQVSSSGAPTSSVNMSWYKKRNLGQRKIPNGNVLTIVWISTL